MKWELEAEGIDDLKHLDTHQPIAILNLLKFRKHALYEADSGETPCTGAEAYSRYATLVRPILDMLGSSVVMSGALWVIGRPDEWDRAFVVRYEKTSDVLKLASDPLYLRVAHHRAAALADYRLLMMHLNGSGFA
jgi:uncharacterized protein (DUF1330 family)